MNTINLNLSITPELLTPALRLCGILGFNNTADGIAVSAVQCDKSGLKYDGKNAVIYYARKHMFFRELGILCEYIRKGENIDHVDDGHFVTVSLMIDSSRCAVPTVDGTCRLLDYLAVIGYNLAMLYTEDTIELEGRPYFGYMRGRYTESEIRQMDDYAYDYGIELIPCLECYGHMEKYLMWGEAWAIKDTERVMLAREDATFEFLDKLIGTVSRCFRSRRIHIGMDEAWDMGRGRFLDKHGYVPPFEIFTEYMERLISITDKYGLRPMMWSDMYFRVSTTNNRYYGEDIEIPKEVADRIPESVELVFWHYGEKPYCDDYMLKKHKALNRSVLYCGGLWSWIGHFPEHNYMMETQRFSLDACRNNDVHEAMTTVWSNDNAECDLFSNLFGLSYFAELCYDKDASDEKLRSRFEACTGGKWDAFYEMSFYHNSFGGENDDYSGNNWPKRFLGKPLFWQDIMEGLFDTHLYAKKMSGHYAEYAAKFEAYKDGGKWDYLYEYARAVFDYLAVKTEIAENLVPAYKAGDRAKLTEIATVLLPALKEKTVTVHKVHKAAWFDKQKALGWSGLDIRYGGMASRCDTAMELIGRYLDGKDEVIEELEEPRLYKGIGGFIQYSSIATVNLKI